MFPSEIVFETSQNQHDLVNARCYDQCASYWDRFPFPDALPQFINKYYDPCLGKAILDVGSGTGVLAKWLLDQGFFVHCIDPSTEMVRRCRNLGLPTTQCTIQNYTPDRHFGMIFAILSLIHVPKQQFEREIAKIADTLLPDGLFFLGLIEGKGENYSGEGPYKRFFAYYNRPEIEEKSAPYFCPVDFYRLQSGKTAYLLFVLRKK